MHDARNSMENMWPLCYSVMNFPPTLRNKVNVGLHVASYCQGYNVATEMFANEMLDLWHNPIVVDEVKYTVVVSQIVMDGPARTKFTKCQKTATSLHGCNLCDFGGRSFGPKESNRNRVVFDSHRR